jgi:hypothetical protein
MTPFAARPTYLPCDEHFQQWAEKSASDPLRALSSAGPLGQAVAYDGSDQRRIPGSGVCAALLIREGFPIVSQRDYATLARIHRLFEPDWQSPEPELDHDQHPWFVENFGSPVLPEPESA